MKILCRLGVHRWSPWSQTGSGVRRPFPITMPHYTESAMCQTRECLDCRIVQVREVRS